MQRLNRLLTAIVTLGLVVVLQSCGDCGEPGLRAVVMTYNIRYDNPGDGPNAWSHRRDTVAKLLTENSVDIAGLQEALANQIADLNERLPGYDWYGVGRDDGKKAGEFTPIFYRRDQFERLDQGHFWLSEEPEKPGTVGWDAALPRVAVWLKLRHRASGMNLFVLNTHYDHVGMTTRVKSADVIHGQIAAQAGSLPVLLTADLNCRNDSEAFSRLTGVAFANRLLDSRPLSRNAPEGPTSTWNGFRQIVPDWQIDFILVDPNWKVDKYRVIDKMIGDRFPSDHLPVVAEIRR